MEKCSWRIDFQGLYQVLVSDKSNSELNEYNSYINKNQTINGNKKEECINRDLKKFWFNAFKRYDKDLDGMLNE